ncbi:MAG: tauD 3 [Phenylobacterium sp.]|nr:tauD 3 [Phenylobacterium sp.]
MSINFINPVAETLQPDRFAPIRIVPLMPNFAARVEGVDLSADLSDVVRTKLRDAWLRFGVLFFRDQKKLTPDRQLDVARIFGKPDFGSHLVEKAQPGVDVITIDEKRPPLTNLWHSDNTTFAQPSMGTMIQIQTCPEVGGNTGFACTRKAYTCLSEPMKRYLEDKVAVHYWDGRGNSEGSYLSNWDEQTYFDKIRRYPPVEHPVILTHPITGEKSIYVNETYTRFLKGMHKYENNAILQFLYNWIRMPEFYVYHHWQENDVAVWDNFTMQHYALADYTANRVNQRVTFSADPADFAKA